MGWWIERFDSRRHDRSQFDCGSSDLNHYLQKLANQHAKKGISRTYVAVDADVVEFGRSDPAAQNPTVAGYYSISSGAISFTDLPETLAARFPRYPVPVVLIGRLAVDSAYRGRGLGGILLIDALKRIDALSQQLGIVAVVVDAKDNNARQFYEHHGFSSLTDNPTKLILPLVTARNLL